MNYDKFRKRLDEMEYPPNHHYDPETFEPIGVMASRIEMLEHHAQELMSGGKSLLDIGSNKGFICFYLRDYFKKIVGYEPIKEYVEFSEELRRVHRITSIEFRVGALRDIPDIGKFEKVYVGHANHHMFAEDVKLGLPPYSFINIIAKFVGRILVVDGPFDLTTPTAKDLSEKGNWPEGTKKMYSLEGHIGALAKIGFRLLRVAESGVHGRHIAVFERNEKIEEFKELL